MTVSIIDPHLGDTYEFEFFDFNVPLLTTWQWGEIEVYEVQEQETFNDEVVHDLVTIPDDEYHIHEQFTQVFTMTQLKSFYQEEGFKNVYTTVGSYKKVPERDYHLVKYTVDPRRTKDVYFKVLYHETHWEDSSIIVPPPPLEPPLIPPEIPPITSNEIPPPTGIPTPTQHKIIEDGFIMVYITVYNSFDKQRDRLLSILPKIESREHPEY